MKYVQVVIFVTILKLFSPIQAYIINRHKNTRSLLKFKDDPNKEQSLKSSLEQSVVRPFPFPMIVGLAHIKQAMLLAAVNPQIGGVVISGRRGTGKSVLARSIKQLLPSNIEIVKGSRYNIDPKLEFGVDDLLFQDIKGKRDLDFETEFVPMPFVEVPLNAMEDSLIGTVDLEASMKLGKTIFSPGLLSRAHRGILYIDDINLLDEEAANILMNVMNRGYVHVEREGVSFSYPCKPLLISTFNPEEGELRSHIFDKIGMSLCIDTEPLCVIDRVSAVENVIGFSGGTLEQCLPQANAVLLSALKQEEFLREKVTSARLIVSEVNITKQQIDYLCQEATRADCEGHRGEIFAVAIAKASAALAGRNYTNSNDLRNAVQFAIFPRGRYMTEPEAFDDQEAESLPSPESTSPQQQTRDKTSNEDQSQEEKEQNSKEEIDEQIDIDEHLDSEHEQSLQVGTVPNEFMFGVDAVPLDPILLKFARWTKKGKGGKRSRIFSLNRGRFIKAIFPRGNKLGRLAVGATLRAAAPYQKFRKLHAIGTYKENRPVIISKDDFRVKKLARKAGSLILFVTDASGSMALNRMNMAKGAAISLLLESYKNRDKICLISFHGDRADVLVPPTKSITLTKRRLESMPCGGGSPLAHALETAVLVGVNAKKSKDVGKIIVVLVTDGRANVPLSVSHGESMPSTLVLPDEIGIGKSKNLKQLMKDEVLHIAERIRSISDFDCLVIDTEYQYLSTGLAKEIARVTKGNYYQLDQSDANTLAAFAKDRLRRARQVVKPRKRGSSSLQ